MVPVVDIWVGQVELVVVADIAVAAAVAEVGLVVLVADIAEVELVVVVADIAEVELVAVVAGIAAVGLVVVVDIVVELVGVELVAVADTVVVYIDGLVAVAVGKRIRPGLEPESAASARTGFGLVDEGLQSAQNWVLETETESRRLQLEIVEFYPPVI